MLALLLADMTTIIVNASGGTDFTRIQNAIYNTSNGNNCGALTEVENN